jgi:hypothetical protein
MYYISRTNTIPLVEQTVQPPSGSILTFHFFPSSKFPACFVPTSQCITCLGGEYIDLNIEDTNSTSVSKQENNSDIEIVKSTLTSAKVIDT